MFWALERSAGASYKMMSGHQSGGRERIDWMISSWSEGSWYKSADLQDVRRDAASTRGMLRWWATRAVSLSFIFDLRVGDFVVKSLTKDD